MLFRPCWLMHRSCFGFVVASRLYRYFLFGAVSAFQMVSAFVSVSWLFRLGALHFPLSVDTCAIRNFRWGRGKRAGSFKTSIAHAQRICSANLHETTAFQPRWPKRCGTPAAIKCVVSSQDCFGFERGCFGFEPPPVHGCIADADKWGDLRRVAPLFAMGACRSEPARN